MTALKPYRALRSLEGATHHPTYYGKEAAIVGGHFYASADRATVTVQKFTTVLGEWQWVEVQVIEPVTREEAS